MILLIDNYDSFSYNLYQLMGSIDPDIRVVRNDKITIDEIRTLKPKALILSPGPGRPKDAGICEEAIRELKGEIPIFGVCLGHQAICEVFGGTVGYAKELMHGKSSQVRESPDSLLFQRTSGTVSGSPIPLSFCQRRYTSTGAESLPPSPMTERSWPWNTAFIPFTASSSIRNRS